MNNNTWGGGGGRTKVRSIDTFNHEEYEKGGCCWVTTCGIFFVVVILVFLLASRASSSSSFSSSLPEKEVIYVDYESSLPDSLCNGDPFDAIVVLGGGGVSAIDSPPEWVKRRISKAASMFKCQNRQGYILMLSAGTAHVPNFEHDGRPVYESFSSALYLINHVLPDIDQKRVVIETSSFDTITNAFFTRTSNTDIRGWKRLLFITSDFHMPRSQDIFQHVFSLPNTPTDPAPGYDLTFLSVSDRGLENQMNTRIMRERKSLNSWRTLKKELNSLEQMHIFLSEKHDLYAVERLVHHYGSPEVLDEKTRLTYGASQ